MKGNNFFLHPSGIHLFLDLPFSMVTDVCLRGDSSRRLPPATSLSSLVPCIVFPSVSLVVDAVIVRHIRFSVANFAQVRDIFGHTVTISDVDFKNMSPSVR